jgi:hypothetical protein
MTLTVRIYVQRHQSEFHLSKWKHVVQIAGVLDQAFAYLVAANQKQHPVLSQRPVNRYPVRVAPVSDGLGYELDEVVEAQLVQLFAVIDDLSQHVSPTFRIAAQLVFNHNEPLESLRSLINLGAEDVDVLDLVADVQQVIGLPEETGLIANGTELPDDQLVVVSFAYASSVKEVLRPKPPENPGFPHGLVEKRQRAW